MKIVHVINHTGRFNGNVHAAVDLACALAAGGHTVSICSGGGHFDDILAAQGVTHVLVDQSRSLRRLVAAVIKLARYLRDERPDVVHAHMLTSALLVWPICRLLGIPLVTTVHNAFNKSAVFMGIADRVIAVSRAVGEGLQKRGIRADKISVVLNGTIGVARRAETAPGPVTLLNPAILFVGGLNPRKGIADLLEAFDIVHARDPRCHLYLVGEGPCRAEYEALVARLRCRSNVVFCGSFFDPRGYMRSADVFVLPSHADPAPLVLSEAREAGCAIVASDVDGVPEMLEQGTAGVLVPPRSPAKLAAAILEVVESDESLAAWRAKSQVRLDRMSIDRVAHETARVYARCRASGTSAVLGDPLIPAR